MSEVKTSPLLGTDANGDPTYTFTSAHTFGDVARWIASEGGAEDVAFMLSEAALTRATPDQTAALDKLIAEAVEEEVGRVTRIAASLFPGGYDRNHARIIAALEPQPISKSADLHDPRDEVIARLVEAMEQFLIEYDEVDLAVHEPKSLTDAVYEARAALAAAKAV